jgi:histone acetyltransferase (RNA polymerase elongator complex component)
MRLARARRIVPVFLPFAGCPSQCVFCAQDRQSGVSAPRDAAALDAILASAEAGLPAANGLSTELAFYGGTFTALPAVWRETCLDFLTRCFARGLLTHARCSTRPDALDSGVLNRLREAGISLVELGVQSFHSGALRAAGRSYDRETALAGCRTVQDAGLALGIQLLPGMPGVSPAVFLEDVRLALDLRPACLRFYPCLVPEGTRLAAMWRQKTYRPWPLPDTVAALGEGLRMAWEAGVPVIRLAVAPEPDFDAAILAGPRHPALGSLIQAEALLRTLDVRINRLAGAPRRLRLPRSCQGYMYGQGGALKPWWIAKGLPSSRVGFHAGSEAELIGEAYPDNQGIFQGQMFEQPPATAHAPEAPLSACQPE